MTLDDIKQKYNGDVDLFVWEGKHNIEVSRIIVTPEKRNSGIGTAVMKDIIAYANSVKKPVSLSPSKDFGGKITKLREFYSGLGFKQNKGRNKDFRISNSYIKPFIESLRTDTNKQLIESILQGYNLLFESESTMDLIIVDVQQEYERYITFNIGSFIDFLNSACDKYNSVTLLYNGDTLGMCSESEYISWLFDNGLDEEVIDKISFYDKGYAFFRNAMDAGVDHDEIVRCIAFMAKNNIDDSRMLTEELWNEYIEQNPSDSDVVEYLRENEDAIFIPELIDELNDKTNNVVVAGGGKNECLAEVLIALKYLGKQYTLINKFVY